ncbi:hypothetical protein XENOCAPTIV_029363 [Xenoophorus captivus]|uniref:Uncharacterized protein n=1 Tax=Xenoophorus captivus TaxID=1517983 RepID=A0ABV0RYD0_9TELE
MESMATARAVKMAVVAGQSYRWGSGLCPDPDVTTKAVRAWWSFHSLKCRPYKYMCHHSHGQMQARASLSTEYFSSAEVSDLEANATERSVPCCS